MGPDSRPTGSSQQTLSSLKRRAPPARVRPLHKQEVERELSAQNFDPREFFFLDATPDLGGKDEEVGLAARRSGLPLAGRVWCDGPVCAESGCGPGGWRNGGPQCRPTREGAAVVPAVGMYVTEA
jgi:hypothetical protein